MTRNSPLRLALSLSLAFLSPGLLPYQAAAQMTRTPAPSGRPSPSIAAFADAPATPQDWAGFVDSLSISLLDSPRAQPAVSPEFIQALGQARFQLAVGQDPAGVLAFVEDLPELLRSYTGHLILANLPAESAGVIEAAFKAASQRLEPRAARLLTAADERELTDEEAEEVRRLAAGSFYLQPDAAKGVQELWSELKAERALAPARGLAAAWAGRPTFDDTPGAVVNAELALLFQGLEHVAGRADLARRGRLDAENKAIVVPALTSYASAALAQAQDRLEARGLERTALLAPFLGAHTLVFGALASRQLVNALRASGVWTELVTSLTLEAAQALQQALPQRAARRLFAAAGADNNLRLAIPQGHALAVHGTIADWLSSISGKPYERPAFGRGTMLFTAFGIPVRAHSTFLIAFGLFTVQMMTVFPGMLVGLPTSVYFLQAVIGAALLFASVIAHEFGHALTARLFGVRTKEIVLHILGGVAVLDRESRNPFGEFLWALAGPLVSVALAVGFWLLSAPLAASFPIAAPVALYLGQINLILAVFNMIPAFPMDGGRVLRSLLALVTGDHYKATRAAAWIGGAFASLFMAFGILNVLVLGNLGGLMFVLMGWLIKGAARQGAEHTGADLVETRPRKA